MSEPGSGDETTLPAPEEGDWTGVDLAPESSVPGVGETVDRFRVLGTLGEGGMGVVLAAYDPVLDRNVAVKLLRPHLSRRHNADKSRLRLLREARAMAKLSHRNVISVYEAGTVDEHVFVAMELIEGQTLRQWMEQDTRSWREIVDRYLEAGRGLSAAHKAGLVHRDFKPENVLVGNDERVLVTDFGLVGTTGSVSDTSYPSYDSTEPDAPNTTALPDAPTSPSMRPPAADIPITLAGEVMGTPIYMAPEQHRGEEADGRSDQFAFCVALYRALYDKPPFGDQPLAEVARGKGTAATPPANSDVPGWVQAIVLRGLSSNKDDRFATMDALLEDLERDPIAAKKRVLGRLGAGVAIAALGAVGAYAAIGSGKDDAPAPCQNAQRELLGVWDPDMRGLVERGMLGIDRTYAKETLERTTVILDRYADEWTTMHTEACRATRVHGTQSEDLLDLRMTCLGVRKQRMQALVMWLATPPDDTTLDLAVQAAYSLESLWACEDPAQLRAAVPLPTDPEQRAKVVAVSARIAEAHAVETLGNYNLAHQMAFEALPDARALKFPPVEADALYALAWLQYRKADYDAAETTARESIRVAAAAKLDVVHGRSWIALMYILMASDKIDNALELATAAEAVVARADQPAMTAAMANVLGSLHRNKGQLDQAWSHHSRALALYREIHAGDDPETAAALLNLGTVSGNQGRLDDAVRFHRESLEMSIQVYGEQHPTVAKAYNGVAINLEQQGHYAEAQAHYEQALAIFASEKDHPQVGGIINNLGTVLKQQGKFEQATKKFEQSLAMLEAKYGPEHSNVMVPLNNLGAVAALRGDAAASARYHARALGIAEAKFGANHPQTALTVAMAAISLETAGKCDEARPMFVRALTSWEATLGGKHPLLAFPLTGIAQCDLAAGKTRAAVAPLERALGLRRAAPGEAEDLADTLFALARALWDTGDRERAKRLAIEARDAYTRAHGLRERDAKRVDAWLAKRATK